jgi:hypothetical protein
MPYKLRGKRNYNNLSRWDTELDTPCCLLMPCATCNELKPITNFYLRPKANSGRRDIFGNIRQHRCKECENAAYLNLDPRRKLLYPARKRAKQKGLECSIGLEDIYIPRSCPVLGIELRSNIGSGAGGGAEYDPAPTLDRIDNAKGYTKDNICVISKKANMLKGEMTIDEVKALISYFALCECGDFHGAFKLDAPLVKKPLEVLI